jgi:hypothetical protein
MPRWLAVFALALLAACGSSKPPPMPPKPPNDELILGEFERHPPDGTTAARFRADGSITVAHDRADLDRKPLAVGTYKLDKDMLTLEYSQGTMCEAGVSGTYKVVVSKRGIRFTKVEDACDTRAKIDGQTWHRAK